VLDSQQDVVMSLADVGGGTGHVAADISAAAQGTLPASQITVVEPSPAMAAKATERGLQTVVADAVDWAQGGDANGVFDRVLLKEVGTRWHALPNLYYKHYVVLKLGHFSASYDFSSCLSKGNSPCAPGGGG